MSATPKKLKPPVIEVRASSDFFRETIATRSYTPGKENFERCFQNQDFEIHFELKPQVSSEYRFFLHVTAEGYTRAFWDLPLTRQEQTLSLNLDTSRPGVYRFVLKVIDALGHVYMDHHDEGYLLIDPEHLQNLKMYTLIPAQTGHIGNWIDWLPHIKGMGFNAIHLLPITEMGSSRSPYATQSFSNIDPSYAIPNDSREVLEQFEDFVDQARKAGIKICLDFVLNHVSIDAEFQEKRPDWLYPDAEARYGFRHAGCWHGSDWLEWEDLLLINYETKNERARHELWHYMTKTAVFWSQYADIIRLDNLHSSHMPFIKSVLQQIHKRKPEIIVFAEYFGNHHDVKNNVIDLGLNLILATTWDQKFLPQLSDYLRYLHSHPSIYFFSMPVSHDSGSALQEFAHEHYAQLRFFIATFITSAYSGVVQGFEYVLDKKLKFINVSQSERLNFKNEPRNISDFIKRCHEFRDNYPVLSARPDAIFNTQSVLAVFKQNEKSRALILLNMNIHAAEKIDLLISGDLQNATEVFSGKNQFQFQEGINSITLEPGGMKVYLA